MSRPTILVIGATGRVGGAALRSLLPHHRAGAVNLVAATSRPAQVGPLEALGCGARHLDLDAAERHGSDAIRPAFRGVDRVLLVTGYTFDMVEQSKAALDAAKKEGVRQVVHVGACGDDDTTVAHWTWHQLIERYAEWHGFRFTHLRPEWFMDNFLGLVSSGTPGEIACYVGDARVCWVDAAEVGEVAAVCLLDPDAHHGRTYRLGADVRSHAEVAAVLTEVSGSPYRVRHAAPADFLRAMVAGGGNEAYFRCIENQFTRNAEGSIPGADQTYTEYAALLPHPPTDWRTFAAKHRARFVYGA